VHPNLVVDGLNISIRRVEYDRESEASKRADFCGRACHTPSGSAVFYVPVDFVLLIIAAAV
jgi:hypothetical protein